MQALTYKHLPGHGLVLWGRGGEEGHLPSVWGEGGSGAGGWADKGPPPHDDTQKPQ